KNQQAVTTSLQVAEVFEKQHKHVIEAIEAKIQSAENSAYYQSMFVEGEYKDSRGRKQRLYYMNRDGFSFIAFGFTGKKADSFKLKYIEAFNRMEKEIQQPKLPTSQRELALLALSANEETNERVDNIDARVSDLEENKLITTEDKGTIDRRVRKKVYYLCKEQHLGQKAKSMLFQDLGSSIKQLFNVPNRGRIKDKDFHRVLEFIDNWQPSSVTKEKIKQVELEGV
ncbi:TPA: ORF6C domain-containing protein, partial [Enterococcus faecalis]|nr:ORF6C domain-containing protein [Enterococcus faecalis]HBD0830581.1 ORF6C domain-containing protein [Enterococcus faecalis]HBD0833974.1 ORF6C domain-containing protein [Enterococcus faecalis]HBD0859511.1 ORF6C domain-containing protein [Enterococcus faecalis]